MLIKLQISCNFLKSPKSPARDGLGRRWEFEAIGNTPVGHENSPLSYQRKRTATDSNGRRLWVRRDTPSRIYNRHFCAGGVQRGRPAPLWWRQQRRRHYPPFLCLLSFPAEKKVS